MGWTGGRKKPQPWERLLTVVSCLLQGQSLLSVIMLYDLHYRQAGLWLFFYGRWWEQRYSPPLAASPRRTDGKGSLKVWRVIMLSHYSVAFSDLQ